MTFCLQMAGRTLRGALAVAHLLAWPLRGWQAGRLWVGFPHFRSWHWWEGVARVLGIGPQLLIPLASAPHPGLRQNLSGNCQRLQQSQLHRQRP